MSLFKRLSTYLGYNNSEPSKLLEFSGYFYHYHKGQWSCLFNDCELVILKKSDGKYSYAIQVTRVVEDENDIKEGDEDDPNSYEFPITVGLELYKEEGPLGGVAFSWKGTRSRFLFEFERDSISAESDASRLQLLLCQCIYEAFYQQHHTTGSINEIENYCRECKTEIHKPLSTNVNTIEAKRVEVPKEEKQEEKEEEEEKPYYPIHDLVVEQVAQPSTPPLTATTVTSTSTPLQTNPTGTELFRRHVSLYLETGNQFNLKDSDVFVLLSNTQLKNHKSVEYTFYIVKNELVVLSQIINSDMFPHFFNEQNSFIWYSSYGNNYSRWSIRFDSLEDYEAFRTKFAVLQYEALNQTKFTGKKDDVDFMAQAMTEDKQDPNVIFDTDDGFNAKDLEDFDDLDISSDFTPEEAQYNEMEQQMNDQMDESEEDEEEEEDEEDEESEEEEEEEEDEEEEEEPSPYKPPTKPTPQEQKKIVPPPQPQEESEEEDESEEEEEESEEEEEESEEEEEEPIVLPKRPVQRQIQESEDEEESEEEEEESEEEEEEEEEPIVVSRKTPIKRRTIEESESEDEEESEEEESEEEEEDEDEGIQFSEDLAKAKNSELLVGYKDRSFVVRGSSIGVFTTEDNDVKLNSMIQRVKDSKGKQFSPKKMMLQQQDSSLLMLNKDQRSKVFKLDLHRPDVVQEWDMKWKDQPTPISSIFHKTKFDETTNDQTFVGINGNGMFMVDPRASRDKVVSKFQGAATMSSLHTCAATSAKGQIAVATNKGEIKLFSSNQFDPSRKSVTNQNPAGPQLRSKTTLPGIGDAVIGIDTTADGKWIVATCKTYLMIVPVETKDGVNGFESRLSAQNRPLPKRLILKPADIKRLGGQISFTPAKFNVDLVNNNNSETSIVTSSGRFLITWNFRKIKQNILDIYQIKEYKHEIVADQFKFNKDNSIVVTLPNDVIMSKKK
ncbi:WD40-like domain-containing protein [Cavenderia fasciculata]|uniref:WD40-like domain-containing protein n=1 Tax=Cavenderia fasciculata TaxID=261658 RepID=F4PKT8_CACFS|nr:WD40-like domain-containing protein [Cavenderia fasciculata]EGG24212.1 WD40-like domain-containing protein [Cavenderia fasciculata]|eukprot:XP_004362063.1 WD40-like domain-containing protein [Cavenderia fasciculata]